MRSIRVKMIFWVCALFLFIGALIFVPLARVLPQKITSQIIKRDTEIAAYLSGGAKDFLLMRDQLGLSLFLHSNLDRFEDARYLFVQDKGGDVISHTFTDGFPKGLDALSGNPTAANRVTPFLGNNGRMYDIAVPILQGEMGTLHLGVSLVSGKQAIADIAKITYYVGLVILIGLGTGIGIFLIFGIFFSNQIIRLKRFALRIGKGDLEAKIDNQSQDEIGDLAAAFNEMAAHLREKIREIKQLQSVEERNRIALDLHDGYAQDLATIIKRTELCERLFKIDQPRAFAELKDLRENAKEVLRKTRRVIFNLTSTELADFDLHDALSKHIKKYREHYDITINSNISSAVKKIPADKSKCIFYIISEALANVRKHSQAKSVMLGLRANGDQAFTVLIKDDGKGFDMREISRHAADRQQWGLVSMRQRAASLGGTFAIDSEPRRGTKISVHIPSVAGN